MAKATKRKADILEDQNVFAILAKTCIVLEIAKEYLELKRQIELKKLRRKLAIEEEFEVVQATC